MVMPTFRRWATVFIISIIIICDGLAIKRSFVNQWHLNSRRIPTSAGSSRLISVSSQLHCHHTCSMEATCIGINYNNNNNNNSETFNCELLLQTDQESNPQLSVAQHFVYSKIARGTNMPIEDTYVIKNFYGRCLAYDTVNSRLSVSIKCDEVFLVKNNKIVHLPTGKCLVPSDNSDQSPVVLASNFVGPNKEFTYSSVDRLFTHVASDKCLIPYWSLVNVPVEGQMVVIYGGGCLHEAFDFKLMKP